MSLILDQPPVALAPPRAQKTGGCIHCGTPLALGQKEFCCAGCEYVHGLIRQAGWGRYYALKPLVIPPVAPAILQPVDFSWLRARQTEAEARATGGVAELSVQIQGLSCVACVWLVDQIFTRQPGAVRIEVDAPRGRARLAWEPGVADLPMLATELHRFGYQLGPLDSAMPQASRALTGRLGVCGALALNNMLFTLPGYFGLARNSEWTGLFSVVTAACATLSMMVGGGYFMGRAWRGLRLGVLDLDLPIALGVTGAYLGSVAGWLSGHPELIYFDFVSVFMFLMLVGRWTQEAAIERNRHRLLNLNPVPASVRRADESGETIALESLAPGDRFLVGSGQLLPVAARVLHQEATLSLAWITGEPEPRRMPAGRLAPAGAINAGQMDLTFEAQESWEDSLLARLLKACAEGRPRATGLERALKIYISAVLALAFEGGVAWLAAGQPITAARAVLSLLVVLCPCVLGLALPMAHELAVARLRRAGVFVRETHLWSRLARVRTIVFDKTGTLTLEHPVLQNPVALATLPPGARRILFQLVENSLHPYSRGLREALLRHPDALALGISDLMVRETPGLGLSAEIGAETWSLGRPGWISGNAEREINNSEEPDRAAPHVEFRRNGQLLAGFYFAESVRPGVAAEVVMLADAGYDIHIVSGDRAENVHALAEKLGLPPGHAHGGMTPDAKAAWVTAHHPERVLMLGDGANDALAFRCAAVRGTPVADRAVLSQAADFFLTSQSLDGVRELLAVGRVRRRAARAVIAFAFIYNFTVAVICLAGKMNPLLAAVLMPSSSLLSLALVSSFFRAKDGGMEGTRTAVTIRGQRRISVPTAG